MPLSVLLSGADRNRDSTMLRLANLRLCKLLPLCMLCAFCTCVYAQNTVSSELLRFPLWFAIDDVPALTAAQKQNSAEYKNAVQSIKTLAPFMVQALVFGWNFTYTPSDKLRGVDEYFSIEPAIAFTGYENRLVYKDVRVDIEHNRFECWAEFPLTEAMIYRRQFWQSALYPQIGGKGYSSIMNGSAGIQEACRLALKDAIRNYARKLIKNKPKEIHGTVLATDLPRYYVDSGKYCADLDFFLFVSKIVEYTRF